jgi:hypothetical protein
MAQREGIIDFLESPSRPLTPASLDTLSDLTFILHKPGKEPKPIRVEGLYPFMTLLDVKLAIYHALGRSADAYPECQYLSVQDQPVDFTWILGRKDEAFRIADPFTVAAGPVDQRFVDAAGAKRIVKFVQRERFLIEEMLSGTVNIFLYADALSILPGPRPPSERDWNGHFYPFFPSLDMGGPTPEQIERTRLLYTIFMRKSQFADKIDGLIEGSEPLRLTGVRSMRLVWQRPEHIPGIEAIFYEAAVNERRPYMRLLITEGSPISKIHMVDDKPDLADPKLLLQWSQDRTPVPNHDVLIAKVLVRKGYLNVPPIYATLRVLDDGTADYTLLPPQGIRKLDPIDDLRGSWATLKEGIVGMPFLKTPTLDRGVFVFGLRLRKEQIQSATNLREKLPLFSGFFQEISALPGDTALLTLRYKCVSNFATEDRVFAFITQVISRKLTSGEGISSKLVELVAEEFQIGEAEARKRVADKLQNRDSVVIAKPEAGEFVSQYNPGIDISIFGQHPFYSFHVYRIDSFKTMERITSLLALLLGGSQEELYVNPKPVREMEEASKEVSKASEASDASEGFEEVDEDGLAPVAPVPAPAAPAAPTTVEADEDLGYDETFLDDFAEDFGDADASPEALPEPPLPQEEKPLAAPPPPPKPVEAEVTTTKDTSIANFFINKLKDADRRLFDYTRTNPSLKKYVQQCQPTDGRQPAVISHDKYEEMKAEYKKDGVVFVLYPLEEGAPEKPAENVEYYSVLRYGTTNERQNYYLCSQFFCTRDEILVREADLRSTKLRRAIKVDGKLVTTKRGVENGSLDNAQCPFCLGTVIKNKKNPRSTDTIIERGIKPQSDNKRHLYIRFLKKTPHPEGFYLPCCFLDPTPVHDADPSFDKYRDLKMPLRTAAPTVEAAIPETGVPQVDYNTILQTLGKKGKYILGAEKFPLEIGLMTASGRGEPQVGLVPTVLDSYFNQTSDFVTRSFTQQTIKDDATGFLRAGVENRVRYKADSFLAAVAPFFKMNSAADVKARIRAILTAKTFLNLNYGNLVLEFYKHGQPRPDDKELELWAEEELKCGVYTQNKEALHRLYNSWQNFDAWLDNPNSVKDYRHFALLFSQPGLFEGRSRQGATFIVLDVLENGRMEVRCPPYGYNDDLMGKNNIGFLFHRLGVWEPIFYIDNRSPSERKTDAATLLFDGRYKGFTGAWPDVVKQRVSEFVSQCNFSGRSIYSSQAKINPNSMVPLSLLYKTLRRPTTKNKLIAFEGVVRDAYNHVGALLYRHNEMKSGGLIAVPVADDGDLGPLVVGQMYLDWDDPDYKKAGIMESMEFYKEYIDTDFSLYPGYTMQFLVVKKAVADLTPRPIRPEDVPNIIGIKLRNGLYVPAVPTEDEIATLRESRAFVVEIEVEEWRINNEIIYDRATTNPIDTARIEYDDLNEIYEHLRLSFSNYLAGPVADLRKAIQDISMDRTRPLSEKRKDLEIMLGPVIMNMLTEDDRSKKVEPSLLRTDCTLRDKTTCEAASRCAWAKDSGCMLHVKKEADLGNGQKISVKLLMLRRLNEELLRFSERRRQIFDQKVSRITTFDKPIKTDDTMIIPEKSVAWFELLRLDWTGKGAVFIEELGRAAPTTSGPVVTLPEALLTRIDDPAMNGLQLARVPWKSLLTAIGVAADKYAVTDKLVNAQIFQIVRETGKPVIQIDLQADGPVEAYKPVYMNYSSAIVIVVDADGPALLVKNSDEPGALLISAVPAIEAKIKAGRSVMPTPAK